MQFDVDDDAFVRAPQGLVYRCLTDLAEWGTWWPGCKVAPAMATSGEAWDVQLRTGRTSPTVRLQLRPRDWRHDQGFHLELTGDLVGTGEFWLEAGWGGTVVHHLVHAEVEASRARGRVVAYRAALRAGFGGLKDLLQDEVRRRQGLAS